MTTSSGNGPAGPWATTAKPADKDDGGADIVHDDEDDILFELFVVIIVK